MHILLTGLNHTTAPVDLRERLAFTPDGLPAALAGLRRTNSGEITELVILSTCNRTELYAVSRRPDFSTLEGFLSEASAVPVAQFGAHLYRLAGEEAARHLFDVAAGLDSLVLGEQQVLGQVRTAFSLARRLSMTGPLLSRLFQAAIHAGKRVQAETAIGRSRASVASLAAGLAQDAGLDLPTARVTVLGAGRMARLAVETLHRRGARHITIVNRTPAHALAEHWQAQAAPLDALGEILVDTDLLIASTSAGAILVSRALVAAAMRQRPGRRPLLLVDLAVPRNIDPEAASLPCVSLYDIDHLNSCLEQSLAGRLAELPRARAILAEEQDKFLAHLNAASVLPVIADLHQQAEAVRRAELAKTLRRLPGLDETERARIEALTCALVSKLLEAPTRRLRASAPLETMAPDYAAVTRALFDLPDDKPTHRNPA